ncbi:MAG: ATP-binding cassette domain-containing protein [Candidatus Omnitrophica bacterium]|nr:ATP-binding cassette domain-containing protein [Candidatus Omnitrophota bacterium]
MNSIVLEIKNVNHSFGKRSAKHRVLYDINLKITEGQFVSLVGPSGCGKSVLLRAIVGTHPPEEGQIIVYSGKENETADIKTKADRNIGIVYQRYSLFPFLTALENVAFGLMLDQTSILRRMFHPLTWRKLRKKHLEQGAALLEKLKLKNAMSRYPCQLSGGMCQRVAIAQALIMKPRILLLDEPFGALDEATRTQMQDMLLTLYKENTKAKERREKPPYTILIVTHELNEAIRVGDRVVGLSMYWDWKKNLSESPGASIVYDQKAPVFMPKEAMDYASIQGQKDEITRAVFDPEYLKARDEFRKFWDEIQDEEVTNL